MGRPAGGDKGTVVLVGAAGALLGPVLADALASEGWRVIRGDSADDPALPSRRFAGRLAHPRFDDGPAFRAFMLAHAARHPEHILFPCSDLSLLALDPVRPEIDRRMAVAAPPAEATRAALDKSRTVAVAAGLSDAIHAPRTIRPCPGSPVSEQWDGRYPVVVKPATGTGTEGIRLARTPAELDAAHARTAADYPRPLVQEAVVFAIERKFILYYLFDHEGRLRSWFGQRFLRERRSMRMGGGDRPVAGGYALYWESWHDEVLLRRGQRLMEALGWRGLGFIEGAFDARDGLPYLFEVNPRVGGTQALSLKLGVNLAHDACLVARGEVPPERFGYRTGVRAKRDPFTLLKTFDPANLGLILDPRPVSSTPAWSDPAPMLAMALRVAGGAVRRLLGLRARR